LEERSPEWICTSFKRQAVNIIPLAKCYEFFEQYHMRRRILKLIKNNIIRTFYKDGRLKRNSLNNANNYSRDYEIINDFNDDLEKAKKSQTTATTSTTLSSKQRRTRQVSSTTLNYKSNEV
jgi:ArsR family metal-binding transcriptional regulator